MSPWHIGRWGTETEESVMTGAVAVRVAIRFIRPDLTADREYDEMAMADLGIRLGYVVAETVVIDPSKQGPLVTVVDALARSRAAAAIVPDLEHVDGIDHAIRERVLLITVAGERVLPCAFDAGRVA